MSELSRSRAFVPFGNIAHRRGGRAFELVAEREALGECGVPKGLLQLAMQFAGALPGDQILAGEVVGLVLPALDLPVENDDALPPEQRCRVDLCQGMALELVRERLALRRIDPAKFQTIISVLMIAVGAELLRVAFT